MLSTQSLSLLSRKCCPAIWQGIHAKGHWHSTCTYTFRVKEMLGQGNSIWLLNFFVISLTPHGNAQGMQDLNAFALKFPPEGLLSLSSSHLCDKGNNETCCPPQLRKLFRIGLELMHPERISKSFPGPGNRAFYVVDLILHSGHRSKLLRNISLGFINFIYLYIKHIADPQINLWFDL